MRSLRARLLSGAVLGTTIAFAIGGVLVHQLARIRLERDTDAALEQLLGVAVEGLRMEFGRREFVLGGPVRAGTDLMSMPTGRSDALFLCRTSEGLLIDASDELGEATATIDLPEAEVDRAAFGDFVLADGARARGAALAFVPERVGRDGRDGRGARRFGPERRRDEAWRDGAAAPEGERESGADEAARPELGAASDTGSEAASGRRSAAPRLILLRSIEAREASLRYLALILTSTWLLTCVIGSLALWLSIRRGLRPLEDLRRRIADLDWRSGAAAVEVPGAPEELAPVVAQLEESRQRIVSAFRRERRFVGDAAHELRTPVSGIKAILEVALRRKRSNEELEGYARECLGIASEMGRAVEALLTLGKLSRGEVALELADVDLRALAEEAWKPLARDAAARRIELEVAGDPRPVVANRDLLLRALANLIDNAVEYGTAPGVIRVRHERDGAASVITVSNAAGEVPLGLEEHAFEPFWRGDSARTDAARHAGLGLALVNQIAELHGGRAALRADGREVVATLVLPDD